MNTALALFFIVSSSPNQAHEVDISAPRPPSLPETQQRKWLAPGHADSVSWWLLQATHPPWWSCCHVLLKSHFLKRIWFSLEQLKTKNRILLSFTKSWVGMEGWPARNWPALAPWHMRDRGRVRHLRPQHRQLSASAEENLYQMCGKWSCSLSWFSVHLWPWLFN